MHVSFLVGLDAVKRVRFEESSTKILQTIKVKNPIFFRNKMVRATKTANGSPGFRFEVNTIKKRRVN